MKASPPTMREDASTTIFFWGSSLPLLGGAALHPHLLFFCLLGWFCLHRGGAPQQQHFEATARSGSTSGNCPHKIENLLKGGCSCDWTGPAKPPVLEKRAEVDHKRQPNRRYRRAGLAAVGRLQMKTASTEPDTKGSLSTVRARDQRLILASSATSEKSSPER